MKIIDWLRPGIKVKRWILLASMGILFIAFALIEFVRHRLYSIYYISFYVFLIIAGVFIIYISATQGMRSIIALINKGYLNVSLDSKKLETLIYEKRLLVKGPKIVAIGGGTGLSTMLRGLKYYTSNITAIVTVADDGGGSGDLREDLGILPPGDIRNCILALSDTEPLMEELLQYRFKDGRLKNQSFGNLFLAAMDGISNNFEEAVQKMSSVLAVTGKVIPVTLDNLILEARLKNGNMVKGESNIPEEVIKQNSPIERIFIEPRDAKALSEAVNAIEEADAIILGPGSLYTSVIPNLLVKDISAAIQKTNALKLYVSNIMTQPGETDGYTVSDHIKAIFKHAGNGIIDYVIVNVGKVAKELEGKYKEEASHLVKIDEEKIKNTNVKIIGGDFISVKKGLIRHNSEKLASILIETIMDKKLLYDRRKIIEYFYLSERLKEKNKNK
ncbi:putative cofD-like protein [Clostridium tetanomorphum]|uniref:Putative gluconeogenesis factor n=1 Tax=Clostridium tetanomorphum TaxID=1553 RepID=A0A923EBX0_CLOTT|nr:uridine diphosphate-N-acetylglucosamine-binding protein YvcK [Clostridium tetanomorphum]KAJ53197.1 transporter [Clostridium tetanomorphum DSM 665]MBC2397503.1 uridine diphosphate-N-acetylglucosamine-binding protein YvcK [Clostridium tetanomorphum]MBP1863599.1 putative cofD-like protein [Clostridium tetanomorphum]NRS86175.1 putative cofD-like protein [Clostridium tetanomorphum]NRZ95746.1 putative cofD-like protein [Clostridium tetanomorphum]